MKFLFIAEKPSSMREFKGTYLKHKAEIEKKVGGSIDFTALHGHVVRNCQPREYSEWDKSWQKLYNEDLPMIPDTWRILPISSSKETVSNIKKMVPNYDGIIVGTDSDIEGYGIYYMLCSYLKLEKIPTYRFLENALTDKDILDSFLTMYPITAPKHKNAISAYLFRSHWDWLIGMNFSTAYTIRFGELMKVGSVKAPTLKLIYDNCNAIDNFKEKISYGVKTKYDTFESVLINDDNLNEKLYETKQEADSLISTLANQSKVLSYEKKTVQTAPSKLFALSDLQVAASKSFGLSPAKTLDICQHLYEAKILTYPRTSGNYLASGKTGDIPKIFNAIRVIPDLTKVIDGISQSTIKAVENNANIFNDKKVAESAHDALIPTGDPIDWNSLSRDEQNVYLLVCKRLLAFYLPKYAEEKVTILLDNNGNRFKANGHKVVCLGFNELYGKKANDVILPLYKAGDVVEDKTHLTYEQTSSPPSRYTTGSIISAMKGIASQIEDPELKKNMRESEGIGTEATRAEIISELQKSGYIDIKSNAIYITENGRSYMENLRFKMDDGTYDYCIADPFKVAYWSSKAKDISLGQADLNDVMDEFYVYLNDVLNSLKASGAPQKSTAFVKKYHQPSSKVCPKCSGELGAGKFGFYCKSKCGFSIPNEYRGTKLTDKQQENLIEGKSVTVNLKSKEGKPYKGQLKLNQEYKIEFSFVPSKFPKSSN